MPVLRRAARSSAALLLGAVLLVACIRRYPAPDEPLPTSTPYTALAIYLEIDPPVRPDASPLPRTALRLAFTTDGAVFADAALVDGPEHAAITETWPGALALLVPRSEPIVVLASALPAQRCALLKPLADRIEVATRSSDAAMYPIQKRPKAGVGSRDRLGGVSLASVCEEPATP